MQEKTKNFWNIFKSHFKHLLKFVYLSITQIEYICNNGINNKEEDCEAKEELTFKVLLIQAIATSIDAYNKTHKSLLVPGKNEEYNQLKGFVQNKSSLMTQLNSIKEDIGMSTNQIDITKNFNYNISIGLKK